MRVFGREIPAREIPRKLATLAIVGARRAVLFRRPLRLLLAYARGTGWPTQRIEFRDGRKLHLSGHPDDVTTAIVVFCKREYGDIPQGGIVVDVGANIGIFSLYAAGEGAGAVYAFEPSSAAHERLSKNIEANGLEDTVAIERCAVWGGEETVVRIPLGASPHNRISNSCDLQADTEEVPAASLGKILERHGLDHVELLKMDCEGAEYDILLSAGAETLAKLRDIRVEYHGGRISELDEHLSRHGFRLTKWDPDDETIGRVWFGRDGSVA